MKSAMPDHGRRTKPPVIIAGDRPKEFTAESAEKRREKKSDKLLRVLGLTSLLE